MCIDILGSNKRSARVGDLVVASVLISMGMLVLPPILISLPFKILIFVLVDGWGLIVGKVAESFMGGG